MERYERDEINFHSFLNAMRQGTGVTLEQVCDGLCSVSMMNRIESGDRLPEKLMRDRIMARMGVSSEGYEDYLSTEEYEQWEMRQSIVEQIQRRNLEEACHSLEVYRRCREQNAVTEQFCEAMELMLLQLQKASAKIQAEVAERAVKLTIPDVDNGIKEHKLLSEQELNLLTEFVWLREYQGAPEEEFAWRCNQYKEILHYIRQSHLDMNCRAMVYPKVAYYLGETILYKSKTEENIKLGIDACHQAIEVLRDSAKLYYFVEIVDVFERLANELLDILRESSRTEEMEQLQTSLAEKREWCEVVMDLYTEYSVTPYMTDFCYMYWEEESYCIGDVIRIRRQMFGMTKEQLCDGICSVKTLTRIEHKRAKTQMPIVRALFERLGLCAEYIRTRVITNDYEVLQLAEKCVKWENNYNIIEWERCLNELEKKLCMDIPQNRQFVMHSCYFLKLQKMEMDKEDVQKKIIEIIEYTIPLECIMKPGEKFLSREEQTYIRNIGMMLSEPIESEAYMQIIQEICEHDEKIGDARVYIGKYEFLILGVIDHFGNTGRYDTSNELSTRLLGKCLVYKRSGMLAELLYNNLWNDRQRIGHSSERDGEILKKCVVLSVYNKYERELRFFRQKLNQFYERVNY